jgi:bifunctional non-homologous end joining protein LigD
MGVTTELDVTGRTVKVSNLDKVLFPGSNFTKGDLIDYYIKIATYVLPHLHGRPLTFKRFPNGIHEEFFYEKDAPSFTPRWVKKAKVWRVSGESQINFVVLNDLPSLVWAANLANIELHTLLAKASKINQPTVLVFDLDPGEPAGGLQCAQVALWLREILDRLGLQSFVKSSGSKGLHFYVPLNTRTTYETTQPIARALAQLLERQHPEMVVAEMAKRRRLGKVFIDWSQNSPHKSTVCVYSLRAKHETPWVSIPLEWKEVELGLKKRDSAVFYCDVNGALKRCEKMGDIFAPVQELHQKLPANLTEAIRELEQARTRKPVPYTLRDGWLREYEAKRDFRKTEEPPPTVKRPRPAERPRLFVIQKHAARSMHYDFRLEMDGVLKSWAVPKGPPYERAEKRLAMQVEDHPLDYARFEGTIPPGNYGAGTVMVWDIGTYDLLDGNVYSGKLHLNLHGKKLKGEWILVRAHRSEEEKKPWFLIKGGASIKRLSTRRDDSSALTGRSMNRIAEDDDRQWSSNRAERGHGLLAR